MKVYLIKELSRSWLLGMSCYPKRTEITSEEKKILLLREMGLKIHKTHRM